MVIGGLGRVGAERGKSCGRVRGGLMDKDTNGWKEEVDRGG